jgi:rod shape-determining protein MreC
MKIISLQNKSRKGRIIATAVVLLVFGFLVFSNGARQNVSRPLLKILTPVLNLKNSLNQNDGELEAKNAELEAKIISLSAIEKENEDLKALLSRIKNPDKYILGSVISRPPQSPYDILIIDAGSNEGVKNGAQVTAFSDVLLGYVTEIYPNYSKVKLISFPGQQTNVNLLTAKISGIATGDGGENMERQIPNSIDVNWGEQIVTQGTFPLAVGTVERIEVSTTEPFKKLFFRLPINLQELKYVVVEK